MGTENHRLPGPAPLPTWHGKGCVCNQFQRKDCPAAQTAEGKARDEARTLNGARVRLRTAQAALEAAQREYDAAYVALTRLGIQP